MEKLYQALSSRTVWTVVAMFVLAGFEGIRDLIPAAAQTPVFAVLGALAAYFRVNARS